MVSISTPLTPGRNPRKARGPRSDGSVSHRPLTALTILLALAVAVPKTAAATMREATCRRQSENCVCVSWSAEAGERRQSICPVPSLSDLQAAIDDPCADGSCQESMAESPGTDSLPGSRLTSWQRACLYTGLKVALARGRLRPTRLALRENRPNACMLLFAGFVDLGFGNGAEILGQYTQYRWAEGARIPGNRCDRPGVAAWAYDPGSHDPLVMLCREFCGLTVSERATVLIHEGLHTAGLSERPPNPNAATSQDISDLVRERCRL